MVSIQSWNGGRAGRVGMNGQLCVRGIFPEEPRRIPSRIPVVKILLVLEGVHAGIETMVMMSHQLPFLDQALKGLAHQFFSFADVAKNVLFENEESCVDKKTGISDGPDLGDDPGRPKGNDVIAQIGLGGDKGRDFAMRNGKLQELR